MSLISVTYNGIQLWYPTIRPQNQTVMSDSGRSIKYQVMTITVTGFLFHFSMTDKAILIQQALASLNTPGGTFLYQENGTTIIRAGPDATGADNASATSGGNQYYDIAYGPTGYAHIIANTPNSTHIEFICTVRMAPQSSLPVVAKFINAPYLVTQNQVDYGQPSGNINAPPLGSDIIDNLITVQYQIDRNGMHIRTISGQLTIGGKFGNWADLEHVYGPDTFRFAVLNANRFLGDSFLRPPPFFIRDVQNWVVGADAMTLSYTIVDRESCWVPPSPCTDWDARVEINDSDTFELGGYEKIVMVDFTLPPETAQIGGGSNNSLANNAQSAVLNNSQIVSAMVVQSMLTYVFSDPQAVVWIHTFHVIRNSHKKNSWSLMFGCFVTRSAAYSSGWSNNGLFAVPPNVASKYSYPGPYGFTGLVGSGYDLGRDSDLGLFTDQGTFAPTPQPSQAGVLQEEMALTELNMHHHEVAHLVMNTCNALIANGTGSTSITKLFQGSPILIVCGYKTSIGPLGNNLETLGAGTGGQTSLNTNNYPLPVTPQTYFNIVTNISDSSSTTTSQVLSGAMGSNQKINAQILEAPPPVHEKPVASKLAGTALYVTRYWFVVMLDPSVATPLVATGTTVPTIMPSYVPATTYGAQAPSQLKPSPNANISGTGSTVSIAKSTP